MNDGSKSRIDPRNGREEVLDLIVCTPDALGMGPDFFVGNCVGSDHLPIHCNLRFDEHHPKIPIYYRKVSQIDDTRFKEIIESKMEHLPGTFETVSELDEMADKLPIIVKGAYEESCPLRKVERGRRPISPLILGLIKKRRKLRRQKNDASAMGDPILVQSIQREMNIVGREIKKEQKKEEKRRHEIECQKLSHEKNPKKFFSICQVSDMH